MCILLKLTALCCVLVWEQKTQEFQVYQTEKSSILYHGSRKEPITLFLLDCVSSNTVLFF